MTVSLILCQERRLILDNITISCSYISFVNCLSYFTYCGSAHAQMMVNLAACCTFFMYVNPSMPRYHCLPAG